MPKKTWIANYIYKDADGATRTDMRLVTAYTETEAHDFAAQYPPVEEFVVSLHPQTEDQFLGSVRRRAAKLKELHEDETQNGHALRDLLEMLLRDPDADVGDDLEDYLAELDEDSDAAAGGQMNGKAGGAD